MRQACICSNIAKSPTQPISTPGTAHINTAMRLSRTFALALAGARAASAPQPDSIMADVLSHFTVTGSRAPGATDPTPTTQPSKPSSYRATGSESTSTDDGHWHFTVTGSRAPGVTDPTGPADSADPTNTNAAETLPFDVQVAALAVIFALMAA